MSVILHVAHIPVTDGGGTGSEAFPREVGNDGWREPVPITGTSVGLGTGAAAGEVAGLTGRKPGAVEGRQTIFGSAVTVTVAGRAVTVTVTYGMLTKTPPGDEAAGGEAASGGGATAPVGTTPPVAKHPEPVQAAFGSGEIPE